MITVDPHPLLDLRVISARWPAPLGQLQLPEDLRALARLDAHTPLPPFDDTVKRAVRDLLRHGGFKPAGRSKPCSEYMRATTAKGAFPFINAAVDVTNLATLHGSVPVSTVDPARLDPPLRVGIAPPDSSYVFNASGQRIDLNGLLCLFDTLGPCANSVKDSQRAKTQPDSTRTLTLIWGTVTLPGRAQAVRDWMQTLFQGLGATIEPDPKLAPAAPSSHPHP